MAAEAVIGALISAPLQVLLEKIASTEVLNLFKGKRLTRGMLQRLTTTLHVVNAVVSDAEHKEINNGAVKRWLDDVRVAVYDADDVLDEIITKAKMKEIEVRKSFLPSFFNVHHRKMVDEVEDIINRLENIAIHKDILGLKTSTGDNQKLAQKGRQTSPVVEKCNEVVGREKDKEAIINLLKQEDVKNGTVPVICIVGMGGLGKTTLAQHVYNDPEVGQKFPRRAWVCVSEESDVFKITKMMLEAFSRDPVSDINNIGLLQERLKDKVKEESFLLVLDDVWNLENDVWQLLRAPLSHGAKGSKIIVTTRSDDIAFNMQVVDPYRLGELSDDICWKIFQRHALQYNNKDVLDHNLVEIGKKIVKKCGGLPLVARVLGGLAGSNLDQKHWEAILSKDILCLSRNNDTIISVLRLSYQYLPSNLKQCFAYCSLFPKDYEFQREKLILMWMAEGFIEIQEGGEETLEEVADKYFSYLLSRSFFQGTSDDHSNFFMHDLMHDLAKSVSREFFLMLEGNSRGDEMNTRVRHLSFCVPGIDVALKDKETYEIKCMRTFINIYDWGNYQVSSINFLINLKSLRVLSLKNFAMEDIPGELIQGLLHLRYLDLSRTRVKELPESLCNLYNLQVLMLANCWSLKQLPCDIHRLINLRYLDIRESAIEKMPIGIRELKNLQILSNFVVSKDKNAARIEELGGLSNLKGCLEIKNIEQIISCNEAAKARLNEKPLLKELALIWDKEAQDAENSSVEREILGKFQPHVALETLNIIGYRGTSFPDWLGHNSHRNLVDVSLDDCRTCFQLPALGQLPSLKKLAICDFDSLEIIGFEFYNNSTKPSLMTPPFPCLEVLSFEKMDAWHRWLISDEAQPQGVDVMGAAFPKLRELSIIKCPKLVGIETCLLVALKKLVIKVCQSLTHVPPLDAFRNLKNIEIVECESLKSLSTVTNGPLELRESFEIGGCESLILVPPLNAFPNLQNFEIVYCESLESLSTITNGRLELLESFSIYSCESLAHIPPLDVFPNLKKFDIQDCESLESLSTVKNGRLELLESFKIRNCKSLTHIPPLDAFPDLRSLDISHCGSLLYISVKKAPLQLLEHIFIRGCPKAVPDFFNSRSRLDGSGLLILEMGSLFPSLRDLYIGRCGGKYFDFHGMDWQQMQKLGLTELDIGCECDNMEYCSFANGEGSSSMLPPSLETLSLTFLNLKTLDMTGFQHVTSLQSLQIFDCSGLESIIELQSLPHSLRSLCIEDCSSLTSLELEGLQHVTSLQSLWIEYCSSLTSLELEGLQHVTSLQSLVIFRCSGLESITELQSLPHSLRELWIGYCSSLTSLELEGLQRVTSLQELRIYKCPLLSEEYKRKEADIMPKLTHIQTLRVDGLPKR